MPNDLRAALEELIKDRKAAFADRKLCVHEALHLTADMCRIVEPAVVAVGGDDAAFEDLIEDVQWAVRTYIVPWDVPFLNNFIEKFVDSQLEPAVRPLMELMRPAPHGPNN